MVITQWSKQQRRREERITPLEQNCASNMSVQAQRYCAFTNCHLNHKSKSSHTSTYKHRRMCRLKMQLLQRTFEKEKKNKKFPLLIISQRGLLGKLVPSFLLFFKARLSTVPTSQCTSPLLWCGKPIYGHLRHWLNFRIIWNG